MTPNGTQPHSYRASTCHMGSVITQCYLPPNTGDCTPPYPQPSRPVQDLPSLDGWKAELTLLLVIYRDGLLVRRQSPILVTT